MTNRDRLTEVVRLLAEIRDTLDDSWKECSGCTGRHYADFGDHLITERLAGPQKKYEKMLRPDYMPYNDWLER